MFGSAYAGTDPTSVMPPAARTCDRGQSATSPASSVGRRAGRLDGMKTAATDMLGIEFPIFAFSHCRDVVAAVSKAGGLGVLGAVAHSPEQLEIDLAWIEEEIGDRPVRRRPDRAGEVRRRRGRRLHARRHRAR